MSQTRYVALLRGINVGGNNIIRMADLRACFEAMGFTSVATYIQSGNVVFSSKPVRKTTLVTRIEKTLSGTFGYDSRTVLVSSDEIARVVAQAPAGFGTRPDTYRYDVLFVRAPMTTREAIEQVSTNPGVDTVAAGDHALYFRRLISRATQSHLSKVVQRPVYKHLTVRNWNTTTRLLAMAASLAADPPQSRRSSPTRA